MDEEEELAEALLSIRACIQSSRGPVSLKRLAHDYERFVGEEIPFRKFFYYDYESFIRSFDSLEVLGSGPKAVVVIAKNNKPNQISENFQTQEAGEYEREIGGRGDSYSPRGFLHNTSPSYGFWSGTRLRNKVARPVKRRYYKTRCYYGSRRSFSNDLESRFSTTLSNNLTDESAANISTEPKAAKDYCCDPIHGKESSMEEFLIELEVNEKIQDKMAAKESGIIYLLLDHDNNYSVQSTEEGKVLILRLAAFEYFMEKYSLENSGCAYKCNKRCTICSKITYNLATDERSLSTLIVEKGNRVLLTTEARDAINRDLLHEFFKNKWETSDVRMKNDQSMNANETHTKQGPNQFTDTGHKTHVVRIYLRRNKKQTKRNKSEPENSHRGGVKKQTERQSTPQNSHRYSVNRHKCENNKLTDMIHLMNEDQEPNIIDLTESPSREKTGADSPGKYVSKSLNRKPTDNHNGSFNIDRYESPRKKAGAETTCKYALKPLNGKPMDDPNGSFYIDRYEVDVEMYDHGLKYSHWNPTQALYEIANKCKWNQPFYTITRVPNSHPQLSKFACEAIINGRSFWSDRGVPQKKTAQHMASTKVLKYIGFDFEYPVTKPRLFRSSPCLSDSDAECFGEYKCERNSSVDRSGGSISERDHQEQDTCTSSKWMKSYR